MIYTSYFAKVKKLPKNYFPISIARSTPSWWTGAEYQKLAPTWQILQKYQVDNDTMSYIQNFKEKVLGNLHVSDVLNNIHELLPAGWDDKMTDNIAIDKDYHVVLCCYEKPDRICHRMMVGEWLRKGGIKCIEIQS